MDNDKLYAALQQEASARARALEPETLPYPPAGHPPIPSCIGATVLGYLVKEDITSHFYGPDGIERLPGDEGFLAAVMAKASRLPMPAGWSCRSNPAPHLFALVDGNPILLENVAKNLGYLCSLAVSSTLLRCGEIRDVAKKLP